VRTSTFIMIAVAAVFGLLAVLAARTWLQSQSNAHARASATN
jgi:Flp pilus assembly protein CpaB